MNILWLSWGKRKVAHATKADASYVRSGDFPALCGIRVRDAWDCLAGELPRVERSDGSSPAHIRSCQRCVNVLARLQDKPEKHHFMHYTDTPGEYIYRGWEVCRRETWDDEPIYWTGSNPKDPDSEDGGVTGDSRFDVRQMIDGILDREAS